MICNVSEIIIWGSFLLTISEGQAYLGLMLECPYDRHVAKIVFPGALLEEYD
jgi:hypothetical protein